MRGCFFGNCEHTRLYDASLVRPTTKGVAIQGVLYLYNAKHSTDHGARPN